jgi:endo-1,4-beta-mannosidase
MKSYTSEVVQRYKDSPAIWGWEFGNEMNLTTDIPYTKVTPQMGTPLLRTDSDRISTSDMIVALKEFVNTVRTYDPHRIIFSGHSVPRGYAWHLMKSGLWKKDSLFQFKIMVGLQNPDPLNSVTMHLYPSAFGEYFNGQQASLKEIIQITLMEAVALRKPLFLGEFGAPLTLREDQERLKFNELLGAIDDLKVPLAAVWVFDYSLQNSDWNITPLNRRSYMIDEIGRLNRSIQLQNP